jgi:hypothetical protein
MEIEKKYGYGPDRLLTDLTGPYYTLVMETTYANMTEFEKAFKNLLGNKEFGEWYQKMVPLVESGRREMYTVVE